MFQKKKHIKIIAVLVIAALLMCGCGQESMFAGSEPAQSQAPVVTQTPLPAEESPAETTPAAETGEETTETGTSSTTETEDTGNVVKVSDVDGFLAALASDTTIVLADGVYDLRMAADYAKAHEEGAYTWEERYDGWQLVIRNLSNLTIRGSSREGVTLETMPRYANVLSFRGCDHLNIKNLTAGHTKQPGFCSGGVLEFEACSAAQVSGCALYGCGTIGVNALNCKELKVLNTEIYECSYGAVAAATCYDVEVNSCSIHDCGKKDPEYTCYNLLEITGTTGFAVVNCDVDNNKAAVLLSSQFSREVKILGCGFSGNQITDFAFRISGASPVVDKCSFIGNSIRNYYEPNFSTYAVNAEGEDLISFDFNHMQREQATYDGLQTEEALEIPGVEREDGSEEYHVKTVDEFLAAIGPNRTVYLEGEQFNLSDALNFGGFGGEYYRWDADYDGPTLVINNLSNFHIIGLGKEKTTVLTTPRYADVLHFENCSNISVSNITAGHTDSGSCTGDVLEFYAVNDVLIDGCGLFGCGVLGVDASFCRNVRIENCEIYSCSYGAISMYETVDIYMVNLDIHDMPDKTNGYFYSCDRIYLDGKELSPDVGVWDLTA